ncbi:MAG: alpha/beta hydrolase fold domain-containing protein [Clostridiales Family XIII bacterium]|nr:alpha/beta hydrolase fold domain-containing protein [Clostridiales Family XIII bacterium]
MGGQARGAAGDGAGLALDLGKYVQREGYRAYENVVYVSKPVDAGRQAMNIYVPDAYFSGGEINGYTAETAPILLHNRGGGFTAQTLSYPVGYENGWQYLTDALNRGYVVASVNCRGHRDAYIDIDGDGRNEFTGKAPAQTVDVKSAVRFLRFNGAALPGDADRIVIHGDSSGGNLSALVGTSGDSADFDGYLARCGAADASDAVFAVGDYYGPTDFAIADMAYEWCIGRDPSYARAFAEGYIGGLGMTEGEYIGRALGFLEPALRGYLAANPDAEAPSYYDAGSGRIDFDGYRAAVNDNPDGTKGRDEAVMWKGVPAFDALGASMAGSCENSLFGGEKLSCVHFTEMGASMAGGELDPEVARLVRLQDPNSFIGDAGAKKARHWWIRHGTHDGDIPFVMSLDLAENLKAAGIEDVSFGFEWGYGHGGITDSPTNAPAFFDWIDSIAGQAEAPRRHGVDGTDIP